MVGMVFLTVGLAIIVLRDIVTTQLRFYIQNQ